MPRRPHQAAYWQVELVFDPARRGALRDWCRCNVAPVPDHISWMSPRPPTEDERFLAIVDATRLTETWRFHRHDDAVMFEMVWA